MYKACPKSFGVLRIKRGSLALGGEGVECISRKVSKIQQNQASEQGKCKTM